MLIQSFKENIPLYKWLGKLIIFGIIFQLICSYILISKPYYLGGGPSGWIMGTRDLSHKKNLIYKNVILGDSTTAFGLYSIKRETDTISFSSPSNTFIESYYLLNRYLKNNVPPKAVFLSGVNFLTTYREQFFYRFYVANNFYEKEELEEFYKLAKFYNEFPMLRDDKWFKGTSFWFHYYAAKIRFLPMFIVFFQNYFLVKNPLANMFHHNEILKNRGFIILDQFENKLLTENYKRTKYKKYKIFIHYFNKIVSLCKKHGIKLYYLEMPNRMSEDVKKKYDRTIKDYFENKAIKNYVHFLQPPDIFAKGDFVDEFHLNRVGSEKLGVFLRQHLEK